MNLSLLVEEDDSSGSRTPHTKLELPPFETWGSQSDTYDALIPESGEKNVHGGLASRLKDADPGGTLNGSDPDRTRSFNDPDWGAFGEGPDDENFLGIGIRGENKESGKEGINTGKTLSNFFDDDVDDQQGRQYFKVLSDEDIGGFVESGGGLDSELAPSFSISTPGTDKNVGERGLADSADDQEGVRHGPKAQTSNHNPVKLDAGLAPATFERTLTRKTPKVMKKSLPAALTGLGSTHPLKILLVDDNSIILEAHKRQLQMLGYACDVAGNGVEAVALVAKNEYDVLLLDLHMPEMDGFETASNLKKTYPPEERPTLIAVTASSSPEESMRCLLLGIPFYLAKPLAIGELATLLMKCEPVKRTSKKKEEPLQKTLPRKGSW